MPRRSNAAFTADEEAFFREGDEMSREAERHCVPSVIVDLPSYEPRGTLERSIVLTDDYASFTLMIEADEMSGLCEAA